MVNQSAPIQEVSRLLDLVPFLSTHSHISLKELAQEFGVSEKAMANELTALSMCGLPGYTPYELIEIFFESGFVTINNHDALDIPRALTQLEVAALLIGLEILRDSAVEESAVVIGKIDSLIAELKSLLGGSISVEENPIINFQSVIDNAIARRKSLSLKYHSPVRDEITTRVVSPLSVKSEGGHLYLVAICQKVDAIRDFRLDRIEDIEAVGEPHSEAHLPDPVNYQNDEAEKTSVAISVKGDRRAVAEALTLSDFGHNGEAVVEVYSPQWLVKAILAHAPFVEVMGEHEIKIEIKRAAENILALYSS